MFALTKRLCAACLLLVLAAPARAATCLVAFGVPGYGTLALEGQLFFPGRFDTQVPTKLIVTVKPGGNACLREYVFDDSSTALDLEKDNVQMIEGRAAFKLGRQNAFLDLIPSVLIGLFDFWRSSPKIVQDGVSFSAPVEVNQTPSFVSLPAALSLHLAGLGAVALACGPVVTRRCLRHAAEPPTVSPPISREG